jgi:hypothetical protein
MIAGTPSCSDPCSIAFLLSSAASFMRSPRASHHASQVALPPLPCPNTNDFGGSRDGNLKTAAAAPGSDSRCQPLPITLTSQRDGTLLAGGRDFTNERRQLCEVDDSTFLQRIHAGFPLFWTVSRLLFHPSLGNYPPLELTT